MKKIYIITILSLIITGTFAQSWSKRKRLLHNDALGQITRIYYERQGYYIEYHYDKTQNMTFKKVVNLTGTKNFLASGSVLPGSKLSQQINGVWYEKGISSEDGRISVIFAPELKATDTLKVEAEGYFPLTFIIDQQFLEDSSTHYLPLLKNPDDIIDGLSKTYVKVTSGYPVSFDAGASFDIGGENIQKVEISKGDDNWTQISAGSYSTSLSSGMNEFFFRLSSATDQLVYKRTIYYIVQEEALKVTVNNTQNLEEIFFNVDGEVIGKLNPETTTIYLTDGLHNLDFSQIGYQTHSVLLSNDTTIDLSLNKYDAFEPQEIISFAKTNQILQDHITLRDESMQNNISMKRIDKTYSQGIVAVSQTFRFENQGSSTPEIMRVAITLVQPETPTNEDSYIFILNNSQEYQKIFASGYNDIIRYEPISQKVEYNALQPDNVTEIVIAKRLAPIAIQKDEQTIFADTSTEFLLSELFDDPDQIPDDMQFDKSGFRIPTGFTYKIEDEKLILTCNSFSGKAELKITAVHDGLQTINTVPVNVKNRPEISNIEKSGNEDMDLFLTKSEFTNAFSDKDGDNLFSVRFETMLSGGVLYINNTIVRPDQEIAVSQLSQLYFKPDKDWNGTIEYEYSANDGKYWAEQTAKVKLIVNPVNDIPEFLIDQPYLLLDENFANTVKVKVVQGFVPTNEKNQTVSYVIDPETTPIANISINKTTGEITISSIKNTNGKQRFTVTAFDGEDSYEQAFTLEIKEVNNSPLFDLDYVEKTVKEDFEAFSLYATMQTPPEDELGQNITWTAQCENGQIIDIEVEEIYSLKCKITFKSKLNLNGLQEVTIKANDHQSENNFAYGKFNLTIEPVNDLPVFTIPVDFQTITKSEDFNQPHTFSIVKGIVPDDENGQGVIYTVHSKNNKGIVSAEIDNMGKVTLTSLKDKFGEETFIVTANDNQAENNIFEQEFTVNVTPVNDAPEFSFVTPSNPDEDFINNTYLSINPVADSWGEEKQKRTYTLKRKYPQNEAIINASISETTGKVTFSSIKDHFGKETYIIVCSDGQAENNIVEKEFEITVNAVNDKQPFTLSGDLFGQEDFTNSMFVTVTPAERPWGEEKEVLTYSIKANNNEFVKANINSSTGKTTITSVHDLFGQTEYTISCSDGTNVTTETFKVTIEPVNDATKFTLSGNVNVKEDFEGKQTVYVNKENPAFGEENQINKFSIVNIEAITTVYISINENTGEISISSLQDRYTEPIEITVRCDDGQAENNISEQRFTLKIESVNDSPEFSVNNNIVMKEDQGNSATSTMSIVPKRWGEENENYKFSFKHNHNLEFAVLLIDEKTGKLTISTQKDIFGEYDVDIICDDGQSKTIQTVRISIAPVNDIPEIFFVDEIIVDEDFVGVRQIMAKHKDKPWGETNETYSYRLKNGFSTEAADIEINSSTGEISVKSINDQFGVNVLVPVIVSDGELESTATFILTVNPVNDIPTFNLSNYELFTYQDFTETITIDALDLLIPWGEDNQKHTFSITPSNFEYANIKFDSNTGQIKISSIEGKYTDGKKQFTVKVDDGESENNTFEQTFTLEIKKLVIRKETELRLSYSDINRYNWSEFFDFPEFATDQIQFRLIKEQSSSNLILSPNSDVEVILSENFGQKDYGWFTVEAVYRGEIIKVQVMVYHESYTGIAEDLEKQIIVYPNPVGKANILMVKVPQSLQVEDVSLVNIQGQKLKAIVENSETIKFDLSNIASGALFIRIETKKGIITKKIIK